MAINKRKILQSAQKHVQKGNLDKAAEDYQKVCKADPKDTSVRLKLGDLYLKLNRNGEAISAYLKVAEQFMNEGFDAKAVALYKQITKLDPKRHDVCVPLAELYQRMGLISDAMAALQTAADASYKDGEKDEALAMLRRMAALDPANTKNRVKVAELLHQEGHTDEAVSEYNEALVELERQGDDEGHARVLERLVEVDPSRTDSAVELAKTHLTSKDFEAAERVARTVLERTPDLLDAQEALGLALEGLGKSEECTTVMRQVAEAYRERGDEDRARELAQRYGATAEFSTESTDEPVLETDDLDDGSDLEIDANVPVGDLGSDAPEFDDPGYQTDGMHIGAAIDGVTREEPEDGDDETAAMELDLDLEDVDEKSTPSEPAAEITDLDEGPDLSPPPEVEIDAESPAVAAAEPDAAADDPDQALAEAGVYLRYGKHDRAIEALRGILASTPDHAGALLKLGEALVATDDRDNAIVAFQRAAAAADDQGDTATLEAARELLTELDAAAPDTLDDAVDDEEVLEDMDLDDVSIDIDDELDDPTEEPTEEPLEAAAADEQDEGPGIEDFADESDDDGAATAVLPDEVDVDFDLDIDAEDAANLEAHAADPGEDLDLDGIDEEPAAEETSGSSADGESTTSARVKEELEEAEFYMQQGMQPEAREIYERVLTLAPSHPQAMLRLGEIEAASPSDEPDAGAEVSVDESAQSEVGADLDSDVQADVPADEEAPQDDVEGPLEFVTDKEPEPGFDDDDELTFVSDSKPKTPDVVTIPDEAPAAEESDFDVSGDEARGVETPDPVAPITAEPIAPQSEAEAPLAAAAAASSDGGEFDLAAQLSDAFDDDDPSLTGLAPMGAAGGTEAEGFEQVFAAFKQGVQSELGEGDHEAHYDLGIAYKEMGLIEDAIGEFRQAMAAPGRELPCLHMMGLCALDLGRTADASAHLEQALSLPDIPDDQRMAIQFDLGRVYAKAGDIDRARSCFEAVQAVDPGFCDVAQHVAELANAPTTDGPGEAGEAFESFDDLIGEADEDSEEPAAPQYESFDEFMGDDNAEDDEPAAAEPTDPIGESAELEELEPIPEADPVGVDPEPEPDPEPPKRRSRKKKISFV